MSTRVLDMTDVNNMHVNNGKSYRKIFAEFKTQLDSIKECLDADELIGLPTETVYGLAGNATSDIACANIYITKQRPMDNPLIIHVSSISMLKRCIKDQYIPQLYKVLIDNFWPGPLTLIFDKNMNYIPKTPTCNKPTVAIRFPKSLIATTIIEYCGFPLAAPSCNLSGLPSSTLTKHVLSDFEGRIPIVVKDDLSCQEGLESTIITIKNDELLILRPGSITRKMIELATGRKTKSIGSIECDEIGVTPGMKYKHYSPVNAEIITIFVEDNNLVIDSIDKEDKVVILDYKTKRSDTIRQNLKTDIIEIKYYDSAKILSNELFAMFRHYDIKKFNKIIMLFNKNVTTKDEEAALLNRVIKASTIVSGMAK